MANEKLKKIIPIIVGIVVAILLFASIYLIGYRRGYAVCIKTKKPEVTAQPGSTVNIFNSDPKDKPIFLGIKIMRVGLGLAIDKK